MNERLVTELPKPHITPQQANDIMAMLEEEGLVVDLQTNGFTLSVPASRNVLLHALNASGWSGSLIISADEDGGNWTYYAYDANELTSGEARRAALRLAAEKRKGWV